MIEEAVTRCLASGATTRDLGGSLSTSQTGDAICEQIRAASSR
jgi:isocitrate/isopropylmalate dehydrogenase